MSWTAISALRVHPHSLAYFNELAGGVEQGYMHLLGSNLDWGQDYLYLKAWVDAHPEAQSLCVRGGQMFDPADIGVDCVINNRSRRSESATGWHAVSVNELQRGGVLSAVHGIKNPHADALAEAFLGEEPIVKAGTTLYIYYIENSAKQ